MNSERQPERVGVFGAIRATYPELVREQLFLGGRWLDGKDRRTFPVLNPATGAPLGEVAAAEPDDAVAAIDAAQRAWPSWRARTPDERGAILRRWAALMRECQPDLAAIMTAEQGKPLYEAQAEIAYAASFLEWFAEEARRAYGETIPSHLPDSQLFTTRQPVGVAAAITPWNFPSAMITRKAGAALAAGCTMVVRPANETPYSALALAVLAERAGVPPGVFSVLPGDAHTIATVLTKSPIVRALSFTGSTDVGRLLVKNSAETLKRVSLELGGHAPFIVFADTDLNHAVRLAVSAKFQTSGQDCLAANRIYVERPIYERFVERFTTLTERLKVGNGFESDVQIGPLISERAVVGCEQQIADALERGATLGCGGARHAAGRLFFTPTVLCGVTDRMLIAREETFGPVAALLSFESEDEVTARANATEYGLAAYVFTRDLSRAFRMAQVLEYGMVAINTDRFTGAPIPFGGMKQSGIGREGSRHGLNEYMEIKYVCLAVARTS